MSALNVQNLTFGYGGELVFDNACFRLDTDWKTGLIGRNGKGKTTFMKLLCGRIEYCGRIESSVKFTYFPFPVPDTGRLCIEIINEICPAAEDWQIIRELSLLHTDAEAPYRPFCELSGGEQTKIMLAALFLTEGCFPLIDEPTNHVDEAGRRVVSDYLKRKKGFIVASHDRAFLDGCCDHIMALNRTDIQVVSGNFSSWFEDFERRQSYEAAQNERLKKDVARLTQAARRTTVWADKAEAEKQGKNSAGLRPDKGFLGHKAAKVMKRAKAAEERAGRSAEEKSALLRNAESAEKLKLSPLVFRAEKLLELCEVQVYYGGKCICGPVGFEVLRGERVAVTGGNGSGKSSLLKIIAGENISRTGTVRLSSGLIISYVPQTAANLSGSLAEFARERDIDYNTFMAVLSRMDFDSDDFGGDISRFSEGQKKKTLIAGSLCRKAHLYVWDEPLNFIDIYARMQIEELIKEFAPTMLFVEHDKAFRAAVATKTVQL